MNAKKSNKFGYWKYAFCFPLVFLIALVLNKPTKLLSQVNNEAQQNGTFQDTIVDQSVVLLQAKEAIGQKDDKDLQQDQMSSKSPDSIKNLTSDMIENCVAFEEALAAGDIEKVRDILKTLDPECLKIAKGERTKLIEDQIANIKSKRKEDKKEQEQYLNSYNPKGNLCANLIRAIDHQDASAFRRIMLKADDTCLNGEYGIPLSDIKLLKGLLNYDAILSFDNNRIVSTSQIGFIIDVTDADDSGCQDPAYLDLVAAIEVYNDEEIRRILSTEILSCPLSTDGFTNDFIVIREMMKYEPILENMNGKRLTVKGLGLNINFNNSSIYPNDSNNHKLRDQKSVSTTSSSVTSSKSTSINDTEESCLELIEAINKEDIPHALQILNNVDPNCYHSHTKTVTSVSGSVSTESISTPLIAAIRSGNLELSRQIIEAGGDVNYPHEKEESPLIAAVKTGKMDLIKFLVQSGAKLSRKDGNQMTALNYALQYENIAATEFLKSQ